MKSWHSLSFCVETIVTNFDLHSSNCLEVWSRMKLIDLTLAWWRSFSAFLSIWFALVVFKVDFSLILLGTKSLWIHLKVNILWFLYLEALNWSFYQSLNKHRASIPFSCSNNWYRFLILLVESWRIVIISGTVNWFWLKTSFHPLLWTLSGLTGSWKPSAYIGFGSLRSVNVLKLGVIGSLRSVKSVKPNGNLKPKKFKMCKT